MDIFHSTISFSSNGNISLINIEPDQVITLISIPVPSWADIDTLVDEIRILSIMRGFF